MVNLNNNSVYVYILAGGLGTRLSHVVSNVPKPMAAVNGKPFLDWQVKWLKIQGFNNIVMLVGHKKESIISHFGNGSKYNVNINYSVEEELLGTGGAFIRALSQYHSEYFILINGDSFFDIDLPWLFEYYKTQNMNGVLLALKMMNKGNRYGFVSINEDYVIQKFMEKEDCNNEGYINGGIYIGKSSIFTNSAIKKSSMENDIFPELLEKNKLYGIPFGDKFIDIGVPEDYYKANKLLNNWFSNKKNEVVFLDRDGIIIEDCKYISNINNVVFKEKAVRFIKHMNKIGQKVIVLTNQAGIAKGHFTEEMAHNVNNFIDVKCKERGAFIDAFYVCAYHEEAVVKKYKKISLYRKPDPGMLLQAVDDYHLKSINSVMIGDKDSDVIKLPYVNIYLIEDKYKIQKKQFITTWDDLMKMYQGGIDEGNC